MNEHEWQTRDKRVKKEIMKIFIQEKLNIAECIEVLRYLVIYIYQNYHKEYVSDKRKRRTKK